MEFEYRTVELYYQAETKEFIYRDMTVGEASFQTCTLNDLGKNRWELITIIERPHDYRVERSLYYGSTHTGIFIGIFKREK